MANYAFFAMIGAVSFVFYTNVSKLIIQNFMSFTDLGIYSAYSYSSINVMGLLTGIFFTVFFPFASKYQNKDVIFVKIRKITPYLFIFGFPFVITIQYFMLKLYGENYPIDPVLMILFAIASLLIAYYGIYDWTFCSAGIPGIKLVGISSVSIAIANIISNIILIPLFGLAGAISSTIIGFTIGIFFLSRFKRLI
jgi:O-antigen/teichoic acid export membrane protein